MMDGVDRCSVAETLLRPDSDGQPAHRRPLRIIETDGVCITIRPMLTTSQKNFKQLNHCKSVLSHINMQPEHSITREDISLPQSRCFLLHGLLTAAECRFYIDETERVGYSSLSDLFETEYRSNDRLLSISEELADGIYRRLEPYLERRDILRIRPVGFGNRGTWKPHRLNECFKFGRYGPGGHFSPHLDGPWVPREDESSVYTVIIYLNDDYGGGNTKFLSHDGSHALNTVAPKQGSALVFNHDTLHEGTQVTNGTKYIIRTEIMFHRVDTEMIPDPLSYKTDKNYTDTLSLYVKSHDLEQVGDTLGFTDSYLQALKLQIQAQQSVGADAEAFSTWTLPYELYLSVFSYLSPLDVSRCMRVCKDWYDVAMDGQLWFDLYRLRWPAGINVEKFLDAGKHKTPGAFTKDWYGCYKQRAINAKEYRAIVYDLGSHSVKCGILTLKTRQAKFLKRESVVAQVPGIFDLHLRRIDFERFYSGADARAQFPDHLVRLIEKGLFTKSGIQFLPEIMIHFYHEYGLKAKYYPIVILEPAIGWDDSTKEKLSTSLRYVFSSPALCFISATVATLYSHGLSCGVVVNLGHETATISAAWNGCLLSSCTKCLDVNPSPEEVAGAVRQVIESACNGDKHMRSVLESNVVLAGGGFMATSQIRSDTETAIAKIARASCHHISENEDMVMSGVSGGCSFVSSSCFTKSLKSSDKKFSQTMDESRRLSHPSSFYYHVVLFQDFWWRHRTQDGDINIYQDVTDSDYTASEDEQEDDEEDEDENDEKVQDKDDAEEEDEDEDEIEDENQDEGGDDEEADANCGNSS